MNLIHVHRLVVNDLKANMLIGNDILVPQKIKMDSLEGIMIISSYQNLATRIEVVSTQCLADSTTQKHSHHISYGNSQ